MPKNPILAQHGYQEIQADTLFKSNYLKRHSPLLDQEEGLSNSDLSGQLAPFVRTGVPDEYVELGPTHPLLSYARKSEEDLQAPPVYESHVREPKHGSIWGNLGLYQHSFVGFRFTALRQDTKTIERLQMRIGFGGSGMMNDIDTSSNLSVQVPTNYEAIERAFAAIPGLGSRSYNLLTYNCNSFAAQVAGLMGAAEIQAMHNTLGPVGAYNKMQAYMEEHGNDNEEDGIKFFNVAYNDFDTREQSTRFEYEDMKKYGNVHLPILPQQFVATCQDALHADKSIWKRLFFQDKMAEMQNKANAVGQMIAQTNLEMADLPARQPERAQLAITRSKDIAKESRTLASMGGRRFPVSSEAAIQLAARFERFISILTAPNKSTYEQPHAIDIDRILGENLHEKLEEVAEYDYHPEHQRSLFYLASEQLTKGAQGAELGALILNTCSGTMVRELEANKSQSPSEGLSNLNMQLFQVTSMLRKSKALAPLMNYTMTANPLFVGNPTLLSNLFMRAILSYMEALWKKLPLVNSQAMAILGVLHTDTLNSLIHNPEQENQGHEQHPQFATENMATLYHQFAKQKQSIEQLLQDASIQCATAFAQQGQTQDRNG